MKADKNDKGMASVFHSLETYSLHVYFYLKTILSPCFLCNNLHCFTIESEKHFDDPRD